MRTLTMISAALIAFAPFAGAEMLERERAGLNKEVMQAGEPLDACGGRGWLDAVVPDGPFLAACKGHDACYRSGLMDQGSCDRDFLAEMRRACDSKHPASASRLEHGLCHTAAYTYFRAVNSRFGAHEFSYGTTKGEILSHKASTKFEADGSDEITVCADVLNSSNRKQHYTLALETTAGERIALAPRAGTLVLQPREKRETCATTNFLAAADAETFSEGFVLVLEADDPDTLALSDQIAVDRLVCAAGSQACAHAAP
jgi:hypothetical protein